MLAAAGTFGFFVIAALIALWAVLYAPGPSARSGETTIVTLSSGSGVNAIAAQLKAEGVIRSTDLFKAAVALNGSARRLRAGEYEVPSGASLNAVINLLVDGKVVRHFVSRRLVLGPGGGHPDEGIGAGRRDRGHSGGGHPLAGNL